GLNSPFKNRVEVAVVALREGFADLPMPEQAEERTVAGMGADPRVKKTRPGPGSKPQNHENGTPYNHAHGYSLMCDDIERAG
ncbi:unnamed protein product, partial [marine sediment metagenome]